MQKNARQFDADEGGAAFRPNDFGNHGQSVVSMRHFGQRLLSGRASWKISWNFANKPARRPSVGILRRNSFASTCGADGGSRMRPTGARFLF